MTTSTPLKVKAELSMPNKQPFSENPPSPSREAFRNAMARLGGAVNVVTTDGPAGRGGFTATAVCSVSDTPPTLLVCLNRSASVYDLVKANGKVCVNTLSHGQEDIAAIFGGKTPMAERFTVGTWFENLTGVPVLRDSVANFECGIVHSVEMGTHDVLFCRVLAADVDMTAGGLVYFDRRFHGLATASPA
ncbi:flavin:NADH oxidoreductase subunit of alternative pyrimidine degradation pathway [Agrobacterium deltaense Zutra 3/1]|uniref:FMN reductase (NADH) RutF n=1 Tax=Agrobacterium deltaense Zutra 3/1 TaxID=1183427 RepID=A0A1S7S246_9HYPH|nr:flavin reductase [Agrobacterium deltaense]CUX61472.1 flavin:NADH oxidoreductase subunit of alternative pyrimidine degradation pathway [Agrobacterium deltaense Zutra 3/1]